MVNIISSYFCIHQFQFLSLVINSMCIILFFDLFFFTFIGVNEYNEPSLSLEESLMDTFRIDYHYRHLYYLLSAIR